MFRENEIGLFIIFDNWIGLVEIRWDWYIIYDNSLCVPSGFKLFPVMFADPCL